MSKIRVYGSRRKGTVLQPDLLASNGMIHIVSRLMDSVNPTVEGRPQVEPCPPHLFISALQLLCSHTGGCGVSSGEPDEDHLTLRQVRPVQDLIAGEHFLSSPELAPPTVG